MGTGAWRGFRLTVVTIFAKRLRRTRAMSTSQFASPGSLILFAFCMFGVYRFPDGFEYRWADGVGIKTPIKCTSTDYIDYVMTWVEGQMNNEAIFPTSESTPFPKKFRK